MTECLNFMTFSDRCYTASKATLLERIELFMELPQKTSRQPGSYRRIVRLLYVLCALLFALCLLVQVFLAGLSIFVSPSLINMHVTFVHFFEYIPLLMLIFSLFGRFPWALPLFSLLLVIQIILQYTFIRLAGQLGLPLISAFHPVNAVLMFWITLIATRRAITALKAMA